MLSLLLLIAAAPQSSIPTPPDGLTGPLPRPGATTTMRVLGPPPFGCPSELGTAVDPVTPGSGLMWRESGEAVGLYRLLDRRVNGCPAPIIVNYRVPGSNAVGRELGLAPAPSTVGRSRAVVQPGE